VNLVSTRRVSENSWNTGGTPFPRQFCATEVKSAGGAVPRDRWIQNQRPHMPVGSASKRRTWGRKRAWCDSTNTLPIPLSYPGRARFPHPQRARLARPDDRSVLGAGVALRGQCRAARGAGVAVRHSRCLVYQIPGGATYIRTEIEPPAIPANPGHSAYPGGEGAA
jgi:hypothetical protein